MTTLTLSDRSGADTKAQALVLASTTTGSRAVLAAGHGLKSRTAEHIDATLEAIGAQGTADEVIKLTGVPGVKAPLVLVTGLGTAEDDGGFSAETLRRAAGAATRALGGKETGAIALPATDAAAVGAVAEGALFGAYEFRTFLGADNQDKIKAPVTALTLVVTRARAKDVKDAVARAQVLSQAVAYARDLVNTPPNVLYPETFAQSVTTHVKGTKVSLEVMDEKQLEKEGCGGIIGVGLGSARPPRIVKMTYKPARAKAHLAYVGKGITFDSGGLCLKPGASMVTMKCDMGGAAAVAAAVLAVADLGLPVAVTGYLCLAENMTGELAQRPGDVVTMRGGKTVEIINTDAEGRLVMADGLALASEQGPDAIVDVATLTGAAVIALGERTAGVMANDDALRDRVYRRATDAGEALWQMPLAEEIRATMDSPVADIKHTGERAGGMMVAATFLREFIGKNKSGASIPWAHIDVAGPAFNDKSAWGYTPKGGTGAGVRSLVTLAESYATK